jgi:hypothetical protein
MTRTGRGSEAVRRHLITCTLVVIFATSLASAAEKNSKGTGWGMIEKNRTDLKHTHRAPAFLRQIDWVLRNASRYIKSQQLEDGSWRGTWFKNPGIQKYSWGETALCLLALLKSGTDRWDKSIEKGFRFLRRQPLRKTYEVSTLMMALEARCSSQDSKPRMTPNDKDWMQECKQFLIQNMQHSGLPTTSPTRNTWHYPGPTATAADHSNTHFAVLGLKAAQRCGVPVSQKVWSRVVRHFVDSQEESGPKVRRVQCQVGDTFSMRRIIATNKEDQARGWCYSADRKGKSRSKNKLEASTGSMTAAGLCSLLIALRSLVGTDLAHIEVRTVQRAKRALRDGFAWLDRYWSIRTNPGHPEKLWHFYYLFALEQACVLANKRFVGTIDWYRQGVLQLMKSQNADGSWDDKNGPGPLYNTCFAVLFLGPPCQNLIERR